MSSKEDPDRSASGAPSSSKRKVTLTEGGLEYQQQVVHGIKRKWTSHSQKFDIISALMDRRPDAETKFLIAFDQLVEFRKQHFHRVSAQIQAVIDNARLADHWNEFRARNDSEFREREDDLRRIWLEVVGADFT